jgi:hypothetical protein
VTPDGLAAEIERAGFTDVTVYGVEGPGWPLRQDWEDEQRREHILSPPGQSRPNPP